MSYRARVFLDVAVMHHSIRSRTILRPQSHQPAWLGRRILWEIAEEDPVAAVDARLRTEVDLLPRVAELAQKGEIELLSSFEANWELMGTLKFPQRRTSVLNVEVTIVPTPVKYSRILIGSMLMEQTAGEMTFDFLKGLRHARFLEIQKACGAYQGEHTPPNRKQLLDAFHVWCAEHAEATHFLTTDLKLIRVIEQYKGQRPPGVQLVTPSRLLAELQLDDRRQLLADSP